MSREKVLEELSGLILKVKQEYPLRVGIDGVDAAGKTSLADELVPYLAKSGRGVIRASIDGFHNPQHIRSNRGPYSPEGYYYDSFNYELLQECLLNPLGPDGNRIYRPAVFDFKTNREIHAKELQAKDMDILIFEGVFLFRPELYPCWDLKIFVDIDFQTSIDRALKRDLYLFGQKAEILKRYQERYIPGQEIYLDAVKPKLKADIIVNNNDFTKPEIVFCKEKVTRGRPPVDKQSS
jgi:uridine kinase